MARVESGTEMDGNRLYRFRFRMCCRNRKREQKTPETNTKAAITKDGYKADT
jgi:hypothetical protein